MSLDLKPTTGKPTPPRPSRARWVVIAVAAAVVVVAAVSSLVLWLGEGDDGHTDGGLRADPGASAPATSAPAKPSAGGSDGTSASASPKTADITRLTLAPQAARCLPPSADRLSSAALAFKATVDQIGPKFVVLNALSWIHADGFGGTDTVRVALPGARTDLPVTFQRGKTYLIAATGDAQVLSCGMSGVKTPSLAKLYADAF